MLDQIYAVFPLQQRRGECPLWVMSRHLVTPESCPFFPSKQTIRHRERHVRFVPPADIAATSKLACLAAALFAPHPGDAF